MDRINKEINPNEIINQIKFSECSSSIFKTIFKNDYMIKPKSFILYKIKSCGLKEKDFEEVMNYYEWFAYDLYQRKGFELMNIKKISTNYIDLNDLYIKRKILIKYIKIDDDEINNFDLNDI